MRKVLTAVQNPATAAAQARANTNAKPRPADTTVYNIEPGDFPTLGKPDAPVTITAFMDFQCPFSVREYPKLKQILAEYPNDVRLVLLLREGHRPDYVIFYDGANDVYAAYQAGRAGAVQNTDRMRWLLNTNSLPAPKRFVATPSRETASPTRRSCKSQTK